MHTHAKERKQEKKESMLIICTVLMQVLSVQQIYKICTQYWDDKYNTESVSEEVRSTYVHDDRWRICVRWLCWIKLTCWLDIGPWWDEKSGERGNWPEQFIRQYIFAKWGNKVFLNFSKFELEHERNITHCRMLLILNYLSWHKQYASITGGNCQLYGCQGISECESTTGTPWQCRIPVLEKLRMRGGIYVSPSDRLRYKIQIDRNAGVRCCKFR